jgi:hypothetical protein
MSKEHPIIFCSEMVRTILEGRKTQARRIGDRYKNWQVGDKLWVKETFNYANIGLVWGGHAHGVEYKVDGKALFNSKAKKYCNKISNMDFKCQHARWRYSRFMPKWAARIWLEVTGIREERLQDISQEDAKAEGCNEWHSEVEQIEKHNHPGNYRNSFHSLWDSINAKRGFGWDINPLIKVIKFKRLI